MTNEHTTKKLEQAIADFIQEREWGKYHSPKNLALSIAIETAEILEIFQWLTEEQSYSEEHVDRNHLEEEIGDVMIYLTTLARKFNIDPVQAAVKKVEKNKIKYPVQEYKGSWHKNSSAGN